MGPGEFVVIAAQPVGLNTIEENVLPSREQADTEFDRLTRVHKGARVYLGNHRGQVLREFPEPRD